MREMIYVQGSHGHTTHAVYFFKTDCDLAKEEIQKMLPQDTRPPISFAEFNFMLQKRGFSVDLMAYFVDIGKFKDLILIPRLAEDESIIKDNYNIEDYIDVIKGTDGNY